jgi:hypothetical protein
MLFYLISLKDAFAIVVRAQTMTLRSLDLEIFYSLLKSKDFQVSQSSLFHIFTVQKYYIPNGTQVLYLCIYMDVLPILLLLFHVNTPHFLIFFLIY